MQSSDEENNVAQPNFIRNETSAEFNERTQSQIPAFAQPGSNSVKIVPADLRRYIKSKKDIFEILLYEGQYYLPPYDDCSMEFLRDALAGDKLLLKNKDVTHVSVPRYKEFNVKNLLKCAL